MKQKLAEWKAPRLCVYVLKTHLSLEKLTGGLFASFPWNRTLPVNLSHKVIEDLHTQTQNIRIILRIYFSCCSKPMVGLNSYGAPG